MRHTAYILYNMAQKDIFDPLFYQNLEKEYQFVQANKVLRKSTHTLTTTARHCFGALYSYYKMNCGSLDGILFWEEKLESNTELTTCEEVLQLAKAFNLNRQL